MGKCLCTPEKIKEICDKLAAGGYAENAAITSGISEKTYYNWINRAEAGEEPYVQFLQSIQEATAKAELVMVAKINQAGTDDPKCLQWLLSRRHPDKWADKSRQQVELTGKDGGAVKVDSTLRGSLSDVEAILNDPDATAAAATLTAKLTNCAIESATSGGISPPEQD